MSFDIFRNHTNFFQNLFISKGDIQEKGNSRAGLLTQSAQAPKSWKISLAIVAQPKNTFNSRNIF